MCLGGIFQNLCPRMCTPAYLSGPLGFKNGCHFPPGMGFQLGVFWFSRNGAYYVICFQCGLSLKISTHEAPHSVRRLQTQAVCACFCVCDLQKPEYSKSKLHSWRRHYKAQYRKFKISSLNSQSVRKNELSK